MQDSPHTAHSYYIKKQYISSSSNSVELKLRVFQNRRRVWRICCPYDNVGIPCVGLKTLTQAHGVILRGVLLGRGFLFDSHCFANGSRRLPRRIIISRMALGAYHAA